MSGPARADTFDVVVVGSLNLDVVARTPRHPRPGETVGGTSLDEYPGGKGLNQAVAAARSGASVALVGAIGDDDAGRRLRTVVVDEGIDDTWLVTHRSAPTGRAIIVVDDGGENTIVVVPAANALAAWPGADGPVGRVLLAQLEIPQSVIAQAFSATSASVRILNPAPAHDVAPEILAHCDLVVPNEHEAALLGGVSRLGATVDTVVVTQGSQGASISGTVDGHITAHAVDVVDTTGAGDAFCGNLAAALAAGDDVTTAVRRAVAAGALATTVAGAVPSLPRRAQVDALLATDASGPS